MVPQNQSAFRPMAVEFHPVKRNELVQNRVQELCQEEEIHDPDSDQVTQEGEQSEIDHLEAVRENEQSVENENEREREERQEEEVRRSQRVGRPKEMFTYDNLGRPAYRPWKTDLKSLQFTQPHIYQYETPHVQYVPTHTCCFGCHRVY